MLLVVVTDRYDSNFGNVEPVSSQPKQPIVETPRDAVICFLTTGIDHLVLHDRLISKNAAHKIVGPLVGMYADVATMVMAGTRPS